MPAVTYINASLQEQPVTPAAGLPTSAIDGYTAATAYVATINGGATAVALTSTGKAIDLFNNTGTDLEYRRGGASVYFPIPNGTARLIPAVASGAISIRRIDQASTTVTLAYEVLS